MTEASEFLDARRPDGPLLSLVIPCYNEERNLPALVENCLGLLEHPAVEVILVDNGSSDGTSMLLPTLVVANDRLRTVRVEVNRGYGFGILEGLRASRGRYLGWTHADLQADPRDARMALRILEDEAYPVDLYLKGRRYGRRPLDVAFTIGMTVFESLVLGCWLTDINAQPNIFPRAFFEGLTQLPSDFSLDLHIFHEAVLRGLRIRRFPVRFGLRGFGVGHNDTLRAKLRYSSRIIKYSIALKKRAIARRGIDAQ